MRRFRLTAMAMAAAMLFTQPAIANAGMMIDVGNVDGEDTAADSRYSATWLDEERLWEKKAMSQVISAMSQMEAGDDYAEDEVLFFADTQEEAEEIAACYGGDLLEYEDGVGIIEIGDSVIDTVKLSANENVSLPAVYPNIIYKISSGDGDDASDDEEKGDDDNNRGTDDGDDYEEMIPAGEYYDKQWWLDTIHAESAWKASLGKGVTVAIIDTGVDYYHDDLKENIIEHWSTVDYKITEYHPITGEPVTVFSQAAADGYDDNGHGTHCAGIIAAVANNNFGIAGIAPEASLYSVKVFNNMGTGESADIIQGVNRAAANGADVISMNFENYCFDQALQKAVNEAANQGVVLVAAAGNEGSNQKSYPAAFDNVIAVAGTDADNKLTATTNYGKWVDVAAPGEAMLSTLPIGYEVEGCTYESTGYGYMSGTSMASSVVTGIVALMMEKNPAFMLTNTKNNAAKVQDTLIDSFVQNGARAYWGDDGIYFYPLADAEGCVYAVDNSVISMPTIQFSSPQQGSTVTAGENEYFELRTETSHAKIYYTLDGSKPSATNGTLYTGKVPMDRSGKVRIKAIAVLGNKSSKVFSKTYKFNVLATGLSSTCNEEMTVVKGKSIQLGVEFTPQYTTSKKLQWTCDDTTKMIKVNKKGKVTCSKNASVGQTATITATTLDGSNLEYKFVVKVVAQAVDSLTLNATSINMSYWADDERLNMVDANGQKYVSSFALVPQTGNVKTTQYLYKSSNTKVAVVDAYGNVTARSKGKATITVTANDGSGKKATCKVNVVTPVFDIYTYSSTGFSEYSSYIPIGTGCNIKMKTEINYNSPYDYYVPTSKKIKWTSSNPEVVSVNKNGKVTCAKSVKPGTEVVITAQGADGFGATTEVVFKVVDKITKITYKDTNSNKITFKSATGGYIYDPIYNGEITIHTAGGSTDYYGNFDVKVANKDIVNRHYEDDLMSYIITAAKIGKTKITYTARDGSNTKFTVNCRVVKE